MYSGCDDPQRSRGDLTVTVLTIHIRPLETAAGCQVADHRDRRDGSRCTGGEHYSLFGIGGSFGARQPLARATRMEKGCQVVASCSPSTFGGSLPNSVGKLR